jgi:hypothetical protein
MVVALVMSSLAILALPSAGLAAPAAKAGPSLNVIGFGINQKFVPKGTTVKSERMCADIVGADSLVGPPQQIYLTVFLKANAIPPKAATQIKDEFPDGGLDATSPTFTDPGPFSKAFAAGAFAVGSPEGSTKGLYYEPLISANSETGPSAEEFNGEYAFTAKVKFGGKTLQSTAKVTVDCPRLR